MVVESEEEQKIDAKKKERKRKEKIVVAVGTRKRAKARATIRAGKGIIRMNLKPIDNIGSRYIRMRIKEPLILAGNVANQVDIDVNVHGGGIWGQADAARTAIANGLIKWQGAVGKDLKQMYIDYDRSMVISDFRRTEPHKPSRSSAGPRRSKQQSKR